MFYVKYVRPGREKQRIDIGITEDGESVKNYSLSLVFYSHIGEPCRNEKISEMTLKYIADEDEQFRAMKKALSLLSYSDKSRSALYSRLLSLGYSGASASEAVKECLRLGYIDEREQIIRFVKDEANRSLKGRLHIMKKAASKGFKSDEVKKILNELCECGEVDFEANFERLAEKKGAYSEEERAALKYKNGYTGRY